MATGILSHLKAGSGAIAYETREESRLLREILSDLPSKCEVATIASPGGPLKDARKRGAPIDGITGLANAYVWAQAAPARVLVVYDWHPIANNPGTWRALIEALPALRSPKCAKPTDMASMVVFVAPHLELTPANPLRGSLPILPYAPPDRQAIATTAAKLAPLPDDTKDKIVDSLCGLSADVAEQAAAEVLARGKGWDTDALKSARRQAIREAGLELWTTTEELGGLSGFQTYCESEVFPYLREDDLSVRRILSAGLPGTGKSFSARWLAHRLNCECARLSIPQLKQGIVGSSEGNLRRALRTIDAMAKDAPLIVVIDEIDTIAREGNDGGTSAGMFAELLTWLQESKYKSQALVLATLNRLDKLDAALESRFDARFFVDLPTTRERAAVASIHLRRLKCANVETAAQTIAEHTEGFSSREIAEQLVPSLARCTRRAPDTDSIIKHARSITPASKTQSEQLRVMRESASTLRRANDPQEDDAAPTFARQINQE